MTLAHYAVMVLLGAGALFGLGSWLARDWGRWQAEERRLDAERAALVATLDQQPATPGQRLTAAALEYSGAHQRALWERRAAQYLTPQQAATAARARNASTRRGRHIRPLATTRSTR